MAQGKKPSRKMTKQEWHLNTSHFTHHLCLVAVSIWRALLNTCLDKDLPSLDPPQPKSRRDSRALWAPGLHFRAPSSADVVGGFLIYLSSPSFQTPSSVHCPSYGCAPWRSAPGGPLPAPFSDPHSTLHHAEDTFWVHPSSGGKETTSHWGIRASEKSEDWWFLLLAC